MAHSHGYQLHQVDQHTLSRLRYAKLSLEQAIEEYASTAFPLRKVETHLKKTQHILKDARSSIIHSSDF